MKLQATVAVAVQAGLAATCLAGGILQDTYNVVAKIDANPAQLEQTSMNLTFNGKNYYSGSGGSPGGNRIGEFDSSGGYLASYQPNLDLRSVFTVGGKSEALFARQYSDSTVYRQTDPGVFVPHVTLQGSMDAQSAVVFDQTGELYFAMSEGGNVQVWDSAGVEHAPIKLIDYGTRDDEDNYPQNRGVNTGGEYLLTYSNGFLSAWSTAGDRVGYAQLLDAGNTFDSHFSLSYANGMVWIITEANGVWLGYDIPELLSGGPCYPDCDASGVLDIDDFICFQTLYAIGDPYADCDNSGVLDIDDFICFQTFYAIGC